jgi:hypothetical protein
MASSRACVFCVSVALLIPLGVTLAAGEPNEWVRLPAAEITGRRWDVPLGYAPDLDRFLVLGGRTTWADYKQPRAYDVLTLEMTPSAPAAARWQNAFPSGKSWGPQFGPCQAPAWKDELWHFRDREGNVRPNWTVYGTFSLGQKHDYDPDTKCFYFYAGGRTFRYDPVTRQWKDLLPATDPQRELGGTLLWSSMCYDRQNRRFILFGGGNIQTPRGDVGTWTYTPTDNAWRQLSVDRQPPARANSRLVYDPVTRKVVLFGGDRLNELLTDTWTLDVATGQWQEQKPAIGPSPRAGHALLWLPKAKKVLLLGGYGYTSATGYVESLYEMLPLEAWTYDVAANRWSLIRRFAPPALSSAKTRTTKVALPQGPSNFFLSAAVNANDEVVVLGGGTWLCRFDASRVDTAATAMLGVPPGTTLRRTGPHEPAWYGADVPSPEPAKVAAELRQLPANEWVMRATPKLPRPNMDWGSAVLAPELDLILRFSGGHSAYSGTAPQVYDIKADRYSIPFAPEYPLEYVYSNDQVGGEWSFAGNPWMTGHTYKSTGYDPRLKCLVFAPHRYTYFFDPVAGRWSRSTGHNPYRPDFYVVTLCSTPEGVVAWADRPDGSAGLWRLDATARTWKALPLKGALPDKSADRHGMTYDSGRGRLLFFSDHGRRAGDVAAYDFKTGEARWLEPSGRRQATVHSRETVYLPDQDAVLVGAHVRSPDGKLGWPVFDCRKNAWVSIELSGADPVGRRDFNNSMGLMYDPTRKLIWAVGQNSHVHVLRLDDEKLRRTDLAD